MRAVTYAALAALAVAVAQAKISGSRATAGSSSPRPQGANAERRKVPADWRRRTGTGHAATPRRRRGSNGGPDVRSVATFRAAVADGGRGRRRAGGHDPSSSTESRRRRGRDVDIPWNESRRRNPSRSPPSHELVPRRRQLDNLLPHIQIHISPATHLKIRKNIPFLGTRMSAGADYSTQRGIWTMKYSWEDTLVGGRLVLKGTLAARMFLR